MWDVDDAASASEPDVQERQIRQSAEARRNHGQDLLRDSFADVVERPRGLPHPPLQARTDLSGAGHRAQHGALAHVPNHGGRGAADAP